jgi:hypothetical protein
MKKPLLLTVLLLLFLLKAFGQAVERKQYKATKITQPPVINGILDDESWKSGDWVDDFTQNEPYSGRPASQRTEFKILFDDNNLYVAFKALDTSPDSIVTRLTRRDQTDGDLVGILVDSFHDLRTAFLFGVSSAGVKFDQLYANDGQNTDESWDPNWWVKTSVNKDGWVAEMKIPLSQVRFEKNSGDVWGLEMARVLYRKNETSFWQDIPKDAPGMVHLFGELTGLEQIKPRKILDITPYGVAKAETYKTEPGNPFLASGRSTALNGGIDAKIGVTNNMTMDLTINPDFGQVEADPSEVNLSAYETFFREKRPFFIEGNNITNFGLGIGDGDVGNDNLFYSRRIGRRPQLNLDLSDSAYSDVPTATRILGAVKLTGKNKKGLSVGFIESLTAPEYAEIKTFVPSDARYDRKYEKVEPLTNYFVGRVQKDYNNGKTLIGGILTGTNRALDAALSDNMHKAAYTGGIDFTQYFKEKNWMFNLNTAFSDVTGTSKALESTQQSSARYFQRPDKQYTSLDTNRTSLIGSGGRMQISKLNGHWNFMSATTWKTPGFEINDLGYMREADQILSVLWAGYNQWEPKGIYRRYNFNFDVYSFWNFGGNRLGNGFEWNANMSLKNFWSVWTGGSIRSNNLDQTLLRGGPMMKVPGNFSQRLGFSTDNRKKLVGNFYVNYNGGFENYSNSLNTGIDLTIKPSNFLSVTLSPGYSTSFSDLQYVETTSYGNDDRYVFASIDRKTISASFRVNLNLSPDLTLQYWGQPFVATGKYKNYKYITNPKAAVYGDRFLLYGNDQFISGPNSLNIDENRDAVPDYGFDKPDFNVQYFLSNLVIRWEYNPGSSIFLVWSQTRDGSNESGDMDLANNMSNLFNRGDNKPHNVFLIKFSYRFGLR